MSAVCLLTLTLVATTGTSSTSPWVAARDAIARGDATAARAAVELLPAGGPLEDYRRLFRGRAALVARERSLAEAELSGIKEAADAGPLCKAPCRSPAWLPARMALADAVGPQDPRRAAELLLALPPGGWTLAEAARWLDRAGLTDRARAVEALLLTTYAASPPALKLASALGEAGVAERVTTAEERVARIEALLDGQQNEQARDLAVALLAEPAATKAKTKAAAPSAEPAADKPALSAALRCRGGLALGRAERKLRAYKPALAALEPAIAACQKAGDEARRLSARLLDVQVRAIRGGVASTKKAVEALAKDAPTHRYVDDALALLGQLEERRGDPEAARATLETIIRDHADGDQLGEACWTLGFRALRDGDRPRARELLERAAAAPWREDVDRARALYWLARLTEEEEPAAACDAHRRTVLETGLGFFTWQTLAHLGRVDPRCAEGLTAALDARLAADEPDPVERGRWATGSATVAASGATRRAILLAQAGLTDEARRELLLLESPELDEPGWMTLAELYTSIGAHADAQRVLRFRLADLFRAPPTRAAERWWRMAYSRPFQGPIEEAASAEKIDPWLLFALAREESTFDPAIVSWAGAVGLTQLMPGTAELAHRVVKKKRLDPAALVDPALNARLGAWVLRDGLAKVRGNVPIALAAYNGGMGLVRAALPRGHAERFDLFIEQLGVRETRRYLQRVSGTWGTYRFLYAAAADRYVPLPEAIGPTGTATTAPRL